MVWTYNYPLPIDYTNSIKNNSNVRIEKIGSNLYIFANIRYSHPEVERLDIFVFDTKTRELRSVNYEVPEDFGDTVKRLDTEGENIYVWRKCFRDSEKKLFKFDVATRSMTYIVSEYRGIYNTCPIIGDNMYTLAYENGFVMLLTINLSKKEVTNETNLVNRMDDFEFIDKMDGELYMYRSISTTERMVYKIVNGELLLLLHDHFAEKSESLTTWKDGRISYKRVDEGTYYEDTFDFETLKWSREELAENIWSCSDVTRSLENKGVDGVRYSVTSRLNSECPEFGLRVFDNLPSLSTTCYLNIVEEVIENGNDKELENVKSQLHPLMNYELDELIGWRRREKDIIAAELKVTQMKAIIEEIIIMERDQTIEEDVVKGLFYHFDIFKILEID